MPSTVATEYGYHVETPQRSSNNILLDDSCFIGVEWEVEGWSRNNALSIEGTNLTHKSDGTLRNRGREITFNQPLRGQDALDAIDTVYKHGFDKWELGVLGSTHVHIDVRDLTSNQLYKFLVLAAAYDDHLFDMTNSAYRKGSAYSNQSYDNFCWWGQVNLIRRGINEYRYNSNTAMKYTSINLTSLNSFGSIEFRHSRCIADKELILSFINLLQMLKKEAKGSLSIERLLDKLNPPKKGWVKTIITGV